jgi:hypothetical protein
VNDRQATLAPGSEPLQPLHLLVPIQELHGQSLCRIALCLQA